MATTRAIPATAATGGPPPLPLGGVTPPLPTATGVGPDVSVLDALPLAEAVFGVVAALVAAPAAAALAEADVVRPLDAVVPALVRLVDGAIDAWLGGAALRLGRGVGVGGGVTTAPHSFAG
jgi:hypothetical protein